MRPIERKITTRILSALKREKSILLLGPRQTGKTTLLRELPSDLTLSLILSRVRLRYEKDPGILVDEVKPLLEAKGSKPLIIIDEVQKVPELMDNIQYLIDEDLAICILTGSSARKLRKGKEINLLPGRVLEMHMDPLTINELPNNHGSLQDLLLYGSLPEIFLTSDHNEREELLESYVAIYLEEEVRAEALVRNLSHFARFLELAASESGNTVNLSKLSQDIGVHHTTINGYYEILKDCLITESVYPIVKSRTHRKLIKTQKHLFFDLGVRRVAAGEGRRPPLSQLGLLFEQFIGLELIRQGRQQGERVRIKFWCDPNGPEVDWVVDTKDEYIPIEVKWTDAPTQHDARHLKLFMSEYEEATCGYVICQTPRKMKLSENIYALPWQQLHEVFP